MKKTFFLLLAAALCPGGYSAAAAPAGNDVYHRVMRPAVRQLDPARAVYASELQVIRQLYDQLVTYDKNFALRPLLASDWKISRDGRLYTFNLRRDVLFSDGTRLTAADVIYSLNRMILDPEAQIGRDLMVIKGAADYRRDPSKEFSGIREAGGGLEIELSAPAPYFLSVLASTYGSIIKKPDGGPAGKAPVGTGPFRLECLGPDSLVLAANKHYFRGPPRLQKINYHFYRDIAAMNKDFLAGRLDDIAPFSLPAAAPRDNFKRIFAGDISSYMLSVHSKIPPLDSEHVRQALAMAVDFDAIFKDLRAQYPNLSRSMSYIPKGRQGFASDFSGLGYNPKKALELVRRAGYKDFSELPEITLGYSGSFAFSEELARGLAEHYTRAGLKFKAEKDPTGSAKADKWHLVFSRFDSVYPDSYFLVRDFHSRELGEKKRHNGQNLDTLIESLESGPAPARRLETLKAINRLIVLGGYYIPLYSGNMFDGYFQKWVEGIQYPSTAFYDLPLYPVHINGELAGRPQREPSCGD